MSGNSNQSNTEDEVLGWGLVFTFILGIVLLALSYFKGLNPGWAVLDGVLFLLFAGGLMMSGKEN